jgi:hypothetical protein
VSFYKDTKTSLSGDAFVCHSTTTVSQHTHRSINIMASQASAHDNSIQVPNTGASAPIDATYHHREEQSYDIPDSAQHMHAHKSKEHVQDLQPMLALQPVHESQDLLQQWFGSFHTGSVAAFENLMKGFMLSCMDKIQRDLLNCSKKTAGEAAAVMADQNDKLMEEFQTELSLISNTMRRTREANISTLHNELERMRLETMNPARGIFNTSLMWKRTSRSAIMIWKCKSLTKFTRSAPASPRSWKQ